MKTATVEKQSKRNGYQSDDDNIRYKINTEYFNNAKPLAKVNKHEKEDDEENIRYKFPTVLSRPKTETKVKPKNRIKVNFWSNKQTGSRLNNIDVDKPKSNRRHTVAVIEDSSISKAKPSVVKVRKRVSFLPSPLFMDNHIPMVTVPDDLTIQLNEEEANDLRADLNEAFVNSDSSASNNGESQKRKSKTLQLQANSKGTKRKRSFEESEVRMHGADNELEFFTKYVVQKLRKMETNQRIYSENLINTVLMLGQLGKLNGKSKISEV